MNVAHVPDYLCNVNFKTPSSYGKHSFRRCCFRNHHTTRLNSRQPQAQRHHLNDASFAVRMLICELTQRHGHYLCAQFFARLDCYTSPVYALILPLLARGTKKIAVLLRSSVVLSNFVVTSEISEHKIANTISELMYYVTKRLEISASHSLCLDYESKCTQLHGHNWIINVHCRAKELNANGMVTDFTHIKELVMGRLDHANLNEVLEFNPTAENLARWICENVPNCWRVDVQESEGNTASYELD
jgi:6-pyruvoyltetrahydropterin/6-carboxytetrahydropterin synthase